MGVDSSDRVSPTSLDERIELLGKLYKQALKRSNLRDELFAQISKQTRNCPDGYAHYLLLEMRGQELHIFIDVIILYSAICMFSLFVCIQALFDQSVGANVFMCVLHAS